MVSSRVRCLSRCSSAPNCRCDTRTFVSFLLNQHLKGKCCINVGHSALISGNKIVGTIRAVRVTAVSSVTSQLTWQLYSPPSAASCCKSLSLGCWLLTSAPQFGRSPASGHVLPPVLWIMKCIGSSSHHYPNKHTPYSHSHVLMLRSDSPPISPPALCR